MTAQAPYPTPSTAPKLPGKVGIWIGSILMAVSVLGGCTLFVVGAVSLSNVGDDLKRVPVPAGGSITIAEGDLGTQTVYAETRTRDSGSSLSTTGSRFGPPIDIEVTGPNGEPVRYIPDAGVTSTYSNNGRSGQEIGQFEASVAGRYQITPLVTDGAGSYTSIAVGKVSFGGLASLFGGMFGGGALFVVGLIVLIVSLVRRSSAKRSLRQAAAPWGGPAGPAYGVPGYGAPGYGAPGYGAPAPAAPAWQPPPMGSHGPTPEWMPGQGNSGPPVGAPLPPVPGGPPPLPPKGAPVPPPLPSQAPTPDLTDIAGPPPLPPDDFPPASPDGPVGPSS